MLACHTGIAVIILTLIFLLEMYIIYLWGGATKALLFDLVPIKYLFHAIDLAILVVYGVYGVIDAIRVFREE